MKLNFPVASKTKQAKPDAVWLRKLKARMQGIGSEAFVVVIGDDGAVLAYIKNNRVERRLFAAKPDAQHTNAMCDLLDSAKHAPVFVLLDVMDQQYVRQTFPPVSSLSLNKIVKRRLDRDLPADDIKGALRLGRDATGRKEWQYMLASVSQTPELQGWLSMLLERENSFKGLYLLPIEGMNFLKQMEEYAKPQVDNASWQILFVHTKVGGFRQIVLNNGKLVFTRLSQVTDESNHLFVAGSVEQEIQNTLDYLRRFDLESNRVVQAYVVVGPEVKEQVDLSRFNFAHFTMMAPYEVGEALQLENAALFADTYTDIVLAHAFLNRGPIKRLMPAAAERMAQLELGIRSAKALAAGSVVLFGLLALQVAWGYVANTTEVARIEASDKALQDELNKLHAVINGQAESEKIASTVTTLWNTNKIGAFSPLKFVKKLAPHIANDVRVMSIDWRKLNLPKTGVTINGPTDVDVVVDVEFTGAYSDDVAYAESANAFYATLKQQFPRYVVDATGMPGGAGSSGKLEIDFDAGRAKESAAKVRKVQFKFRGLLPEQR